MQNNYRASYISFLDQKKLRKKSYKKIRDEQAKNTDELATLIQIKMREKEGTYEMQIYCGEFPRLSGWTQGGAAADVEGNGECYGSGGAREAER